MTKNPLCKIKFIINYIDLFDSDFKKCIILV